MSNYIRRHVSQNRKRFVEGAYNLDLTYICNNVIAMGYPSDKAMQGLIRNPIDTVSRYLKEKHPDSFKVFNLCQESDYNFCHFDNMVEVIPIEDHNPPRFTQIEQFCTGVQKWLEERKDNVAIVHCKAGKGRTGTMISCYFIYSKKFTNPFDAMSEFDRKRCIDQKGVTIPSQRRYVEYFSDFFLNKRPYKKIELSLKSIEINIVNNNDFPDVIRFRLYKNLTKLCYDQKKIKLNKDAKTFSFELNPIRITDDVKFCFLSSKKVVMLKFILNTCCFLQDNVFAENEKSCQGTKTYDNNGFIYWTLKKKDIDVAFKNKNIHPDLTVKVKFQIVKNSDSQYDYLDYKSAGSCSSLPKSDESRKNSAQFLEVPIFEPTLNKINRGSDVTSKSTGSNDSVYDNEYNNNEEDHQKRINLFDKLFNKKLPPNRTKSAPAYSNVVESLPDNIHSSHRNSDPDRREKINEFKSNIEINSNIATPVITRKLTKKSRIGTFMFLFRKKRQTEIPKINLCQMNAN